MLEGPEPKEMGRPTLYKQEYCDIVVSLGKQGKSKAQMCAVLNIGRSTMADWEREYEVFRESLMRAREHSQAWWEAHAQNNLKTKHYQANLWRYSMAGRFKDDYAERPQATATELVDFLSAVVDAAGERQKKIQPSDAAKAIEVEASTLQPAAVPVKRGK